MTGRPHHPECPNLFVPDVFIKCWECGAHTEWCGCMWRCPVHDQAPYAENAASPGEG